MCTSAYDMDVQMHFGYATYDSLVVSWGTFEAMRSLLGGPFTENDVPKGSIERNGWIWRRLMVQEGKMLTSEMWWQQRQREKYFGIINLRKIQEWEKKGS